jgi:hypothetical protein
MKTFEELKELILKIAVDKGACKIEFLRAKDSENIQELLTVIKENANWCYNNGVFENDVIGLFPDEDLIKSNIFYKKENISQESEFAIYISSTSEHYGSSTSKHYDSSTSEHYDSSTSEHYDSSTSKHYGSSTSKHYDSSTSEHYDSSTSEHYGSSTSKHYGSSTSEHYDSSTSKHYGSSTSKHYGSSYGNVYVLNNTKIINDSAIIRERSSNKVYLKKGKFEIIEL